MQIINLYQHSWKQSLLTTKALNGFLRNGANHSLYKAQPDGNQNQDWALEWLDGPEAARKAAVEATLVAVRHSPFSVDLPLQAHSRDHHQVELSLILTIELSDPRQFALEWLRQHQQALTLQQWLPELTAAINPAWQSLAARLDYSELAQCAFTPQLQESLKPPLNQLEIEILEVKITNLHSASGSAAQQQQAEIELQRQEAERARQQQEIERQRQQAEIELQRERERLQHQDNISEQERRAELYRTKIASELKIADAERTLSQKELEIAQLRQQTQQINAAISESDRKVSADNLANLEQRLAEQQAFIDQLQRSKQALREAIDAGMAPKQPEKFSQSQGGYSESTLSSLGVTELARHFHSWCFQRSRSGDLVIKHKRAQTRSLQSVEVKTVLIGEEVDFSMTLRRSTFPEDQFLYLTLICLGSDQQNNFLLYPCRNHSDQDDSDLLWRFYKCNSFVEEYYNSVCSKSIRLKEFGPAGSSSVIALLSTEPLLSEKHISQFPPDPEPEQLTTHLQDHQLQHILQSAKNLTKANANNLKVACFDYEVVAALWDS